MPKERMSDKAAGRCDFPFLNPQTGPFYIEGAEVGDTVAVHFIDIEPARDWAASTTVPLFGALTATRATALLHEALPEIVWIWELDRKARTCIFRAHSGDFTTAFPLEPMHAGRWGWHRPAWRCAPLSGRMPSGATWTRPR
jgi:acetamidase/formamidase